MLPIAMTPPMGWNSFICFGWSINEKEMKANIDYMAKKLRPFGWEYAVLDFCWYYPGADCRPCPDQETGFTPHLSIDEYGRLLPDKDRFPSSVNGRGLLPIAEYVHQKGLKFGLHIMRGIPRQAVANHLPILGCNRTADQVADTNSVCPWLNHMYGLDMQKPGAQEYLNSLFELYSEWGVDYIKIDDLSFPYHEAEIEGYRKAINACGRPIVFSTSPGETTLSAGAHISSHANLWRISGDFWDTWPELLAQFKRLKDWTPYRKPGAWPDADMLPLGHIALRGPVRETRYCDFTPDEQQTMMSLWAIAKSPLMMGGHLPDTPEETLSMLTNREMLRINQQSTDNHEVSREDSLIVWEARGENGEKHLALFNVGDTALSVSYPFKRIAIDGAVTVLDVWSGQKVENLTEYQGILPPHGSLLLTLEE